jgi:hypothetical protein
MENDRAQAAGEDLEFVRKALAREARAPFPRAVALLWAAIALVGFPLFDFAPSAVPVYWTFAGPLGFAISLWLGRRSARAAGLEDRAEAARWSRHWLGLLIAIALVVVASIAGRLGWQTTGSTILLLLAAFYFTAGIHLHRGLLPVAALLGAGYLLVLFVEGRTWTWLGVATAAALAATALLGGGSRRG